MNFELTEEQRHFPLAATRRAAEQNYLSLYIDKADGGLGLSRLTAALIFEQLAAGCDAITAYLTIHNRACWILARFAGDALKTIWLPRMIAGELPASYCLTEPDAGSDAAHLRTRTRRDGDVYVLQGSKCLISGSGSTDVLIVMARTGEDGAKGISCFLVPADAAGIRYGQAAGRVPGPAVQARRQLPQLTASRQMALLAADRLDRGHPQASLYCAMAKRFTTDPCFEICNEPLQLHGGYGYLNDYPLER